MARSLEKTLNRERRLWKRVEPNGIRWMTYAYFYALSLGHAADCRADTRESACPADRGPCLESYGTTPRFAVNTESRQYLARCFRLNQWSGYWITIFFCYGFTPPLAFCAVIVITLSPVGNGGVK